MPIGRRAARYRLADRQCFGAARPELRARRGRTRSDVVHRVPRQIRQADARSLGSRLDGSDRAHRIWRGAGPGLCNRTGVQPSRDRRSADRRAEPQRRALSDGGRQLVVDRGDDRAIGEKVDAAAVIVAVPIAIISRIGFGVQLPPLWRQFNAEVGLGKNGKIQAVTASRPWERPIGRGGEIWQVDHAAGSSLGWDGGVRPSASAGSVWTWFTGGSEVSAADKADPRALALHFAKLAESGVMGMSTATGTTVRRTNWHLDPFSMGAYVNFRPGQLTKFAGLIWTETDGGASSPLSAGPVHFAGEHLSDAYPGYMNGGAQTGRLAARSVFAARAPALGMG